MSHKELSQYEVIKRLLRQEINGSKAAEVLAITSRHIRRLKAKVKTAGAKALIHGNRGKPSNHKVPKPEQQRIMKLLHGRYPDFGPTLATEKLAENHGIDRDVKTIRRIMIAQGLWKPKVRKQIHHRSWRPRRECFGELQQFDGSYEYWFEDRAPKCCLLASIDDATGKITKAQFAAHEGVVPVFTFWQGYLLKNGKPRAIYLDQFSTYKMNPGFAKDNHELKTQFERAMQELGIEPITAYSPEAKGRVERLFGTLQDRLIKELRLRGISTAAGANQYLEKEFVPEFNRRFAVEPKSAVNLHRPLALPEQKQLSAILSRQHVRSVYNDFTISFQNQWCQITSDQPALIRPKDRIIVEQRLDESIHLRLRNKYLVYQVLPERPKKTIPKSWALPNLLPRRIYKPALDHPWRKFEYSSKTNS
ncbi:MAG: ISNCY family transposase [Candidatus Peregrinibacteria bacterium]